MNTGSPPSLLLVEDTLDEEFLALRSISRSGIESNVIVQRDGLTALYYLCDERSPPPALIILDYDLPKLNGREFLIRLRACEKTRYIPVVVFSSAPKSNLVDCYRLGANSCVAKPIDSDEYAERMISIARYWLSFNLTWDHVNQGSVSMSG